MIDISAIKARLSCVTYAQQRGLPITKSGDRCVSPLRVGAQNKTSFAVYDEFYFDFGSGEGGDVIDLAAALQFEGDKGKAIRELARITGVDIPNYKPTGWKEYTHRLNNEIQHYHEQLTPEDREYLHRRGIKDETIDRVKLGRTNNGRLCFPYWKNGYICYYASRYLEGGAHPKSKYMKMPRDDFNDHTVWGLHTIDRSEKRDLLVIAEGAFDALSFDQEGYSVISAITGNFSREQLPTALSIARSFERTLLVYDNDNETRAGEKFTIKMARILTEKSIPCIVGSVPPRYKDISDFYADGGDLADIIDSAEDAVTFLASKISDTAEFERFSRRVCRYMSKPSVDMFFKKIERTGKFDSDWLKSLCKDCKSPPLDKAVAAEIIEKHRLLYNEKMSFFEYNGRYWVERGDTEIGSYVSEALGIYATGQRIASIRNVIKSMTVTNRIFNVQPVMNFINGTLEIEPEIKFREHREGDLCTYCLGYPYKPGTHSREWDAFLSSITDHDDKKICLLQELSGYVLFPDNRLQKCAVFIGSGANGKSMFLNVLSSIFGASNISNVEMSSLTQPFQTIRLMNSMLNISAETRTNVNGAESIFKQIVAGDEISACFKGKDYIDFRPRAKMFLACNEYVKSNDTSDGWTRRFCFVNFPVKFVEYPKADNERQIDRDIESRLTTDDSLSAIFNWVLEGYVMLKNCGYFTEPDDQQRINEEFKELSNPLIEFVKELTVDRRYSNAHLYLEYKNWCEDSGHNPLARNTFIRRFVNAVKEYRPDIGPYKSMNERGYEPKSDKNTPF